jgi:four helix bundle protein
VEVARIESRESSKVKSYRDLLVWQKSMDFAMQVYDIAKTFPKEELYGMTSQMKRSALSIPSNIAEGSSRRTTGEFLRYINIATGSLAEIETQIIFAARRKFIAQIKEEILLKDADEISRMLQGLYRSLESKSSRLSTLDSNH